MCRRWWNVQINCKEIETRMSPKWNSEKKEKIKMIKYDFICSGDTHTQFDGHGTFLVDLNVARNRLTTSPFPFLDSTHFYHLFFRPSCALPSD